MRSSKTARGIKNSICQQAAYEKWMLSRPGQVACVNSLKEKVGIGKDKEVRKCLRPSEIRNHENSVLKFIHVLENDFLDPFSPHLDESALYNMSSGTTVQENVSVLAKCL